MFSEMTILAKDAKNFYIKILQTIFQIGVALGQYNHFYLIYIMGKVFISEVKNVID